MLSVSNVFIKYGDRVLFDHISYVITDRDKVGLVGRNGAGKSTMLKTIAGEITPDEGSIVRPASSTLGFLHQEMDIPMGKTVIVETLSAFGDVKKMEKRLEEINVEMATRTDYTSDSYSDLIVEFTELNDRFLMLGGDRMQAEAERVLKGLGFKQTDLQRLTDEFSGGWQMRIILAKMLLQQPDYLLLDEPTNHLDIESIIWLEDFLKTYPGALIVISHDKQFLDNVTKRTVEIEMGKAHDYKGSYSKYVELRAERREKLEASFQNQQKMIAQRERTITRFMAKATKTKMAQSMKKQLDKVERIEMDTEDTAAMNIRFPTAPRSGLVTVEGKNVVKKYDDLTVLSGVGLKLDRGDRVSFVGQNGQGKTTLAKIIVDKIPASSGEITLGHNVSIGYYAQNQSDVLDPNITLLETMELHSPPEMRTKLRNILGSFLFSGEDVEKKVVVLSGGERARLALACMLLRPFNLLVLDEPTNHLDMISKEVLKQALMHFDGTLIIVSHDRDFLAGLTDKTIEFRDKQLFHHLGDINYFLKRRKMDNMREVELQKQKAEQQAAEKAKSPTVELSFEERKRLTRDVSNAEKKVERLEEKIAKFELEMAKADFYEKPDYQSLMDVYKKDKNDLDVAMAKWEKAQEVLDAAG